jgi:hypothetical protein
MSSHGNFGAAVYVREALINDVVKAAHFRYGDSFRKSISHTLSLGETSVVVSGAVFVQTPHVTLRAADTKARVTLSGWARLRLKTWNVDEACVANLNAELLVPLVLDGVEAGWDKVFLDLSAFDLVSATVAVPWVSPLPGVHAPALALNAEFRQLLVDAIRPMAKRILRINVPIEMLAQMQLSLAAQSLPYYPQIRIQSVMVMDGALAVGFDLFTGPTRETTGDMNALVQPWTEWATRFAAERASAGILQSSTSPDEVQIIVAIEPSMFLKYAGLNLKLQVKRISFPEDIRVDEVALTLIPGAANLFLRLTVHHDDPFPDDHIRVSTGLVPMPSYILMLNTDASFFSGGSLEGLLDVVTGLVTDYIRLMAKNSIGGAVRGANWAFATAGFRGDLPGATGSPGKAKVSVTHAGTAIDPDFVLVGIRAEVFASNSTETHETSDGSSVFGVGMSSVIDNPNILPSFDVIWTHTSSTVGIPIRSRMLRLEVPAHPTLLRDPSLRIAWEITIHKQDGTVGIFSQDGWSDDPGARAIVVDLWSEEFYFADRLDLRCAHYRPPSGELAVSQVTVTISDRFRRDFPFVRWYREVSWTATENGKRVPKSKLRSSAVHKTDIRQRCKFCDAGRNDSRVIGSNKQYFTEIPVPSAEPYRTTLCEYCFGSV